jgi:serine/threonine protein kinase
MGPSMTRTYEEQFLALAVKHGMMRPQEARAALAAFRAQPDGAAKPIDRLLLERRALSAEQIQKIRASGGRAAPDPARTTVRLAAKKPDPQEPIPGYRLTGKLGVGGTATVFLAEDRKHEARPTALKILLPQRGVDPKFVERFRREAELLIRFDHPNIVKGYDYGKVQYEGMPPLHYMALEYVPGESVQSILNREGRLDEPRAVAIILAAAQAVDYMSRNRLIHRDIKPDNLMVAPDGRIKLLDLGFAIPMGEEGTRLEEEGTTSGTAQYMSPEQAQGLSDLDVRSDIYSLGATLYHMVVGDVPFSGADSLEVMAKQVLEALNATSLKNRTISKHMHYFIERMMSKDKDFRYADAGEMTRDIQELREGFESLQYKPEAEPPSPPPRKGTTRLMRRPDAPRRSSALDRITRRKQR